MNGWATGRGSLVNWLVRDAYPLWSQNGVEHATGGFIEALDRNGCGLAWPRRARIHPRQVYAFAQGPALGWAGDASGIVSRGMSYFTRYYRRQDGFFLTLADAHGQTQDSRALLYDQAFVLLGYASAAVALDTRDEWESRALELRRLIEVRLRTDDGGYRSEEGSGGYESNPHMHLLEAYIAWAEIGRDAGWVKNIRSLVALVTTRLIRKDCGAIGEFYLASWQPAPRVAEHSIEPGHQFEWAWLLFRCQRWLRESLCETALRLIDIGERRGVSGGVAVNALRDDLSIHDGSARLWAQCERLKAALLAARLTGQQRYWTMADSATMSLFPYLNTTVPGLWFDTRTADGEMSPGAVPASTFYHLVSAIVISHCTRGDRP